MATESLQCSSAIRNRSRGSRHSSHPLAITTAAASTTMMATVMVLMVSTVAVSMLSVGAAFPHGKGCGAGLFETGDPVTVEQEYHTPQEAARRLAVITAQTYKTRVDSTFLTVADADRAGLTAGIRIKVLYDVVDGGDYTGTRAGAQALQCIQAGMTMQVACSSGAANCWQSWTGCKEEDVITKTSDKLAVMKTRIEWVAEYLNRAIRLKPVQGNINIAASIRTTYNFATASVSDADLVIIFTARPVPGQSLAGFASCLQTDQHGRCTVGVFNWVPNVVDVAGKNAATTISSERHTALHETIHLLGGMFPNGPFIDDNGITKTSGVYIVESDGSEYTRPAVKIVTSRVLSMARKHFGCDAMTGMPLEDQPTGKLAHWEARLMGPEVMSYGTGTGETYMSDLTFAYLEDTNQYIANYTFGGRLVVTTADTGAKHDFSDMIDMKEAPPAASSPGRMRWGRGEGCNFVQKSAKQWSSSYACGLQREFSCTPDNRLSAVCDVQTDIKLPSNKQWTCGSYTAATGASCTATPNDNCDSQGCYLPKQLQFFASDADATKAAGVTAKASNTGGFSSAMDYVPVRLGYWNCQDTKATTNVTRRFEQEAGKLDLGGLTDGAEDAMPMFGGQAFCPECRCFLSSLMEFSSASVNPKFPQFGLCYRSNCFREDYLQIAIESQLGEPSWYACPPEGGKLYIAGFSGAFHCPVAKQFCAFETITGIKYRETQVWWEWVMWACVVGVPSLFFLVCCCIPPLREWAITKSKYYTGVSLLENPSENDEDGRELPPVCPSTTLTGLNVLMLLCGLALMGLSVVGASTNRAAQAIPMLLAISFFWIVTSTLGAVGAGKRAYGTSCILLSYFFIVLCCAAGFTFLCAWAYFYTAEFNVVVARNWNAIADALPENVVRKVAAAGTASAVVSDNLDIVGGFSAGLFIVMLTAVACSILIISIPVLMATIFLIACYTFVLSGVALVVIGCYATLFAQGVDTRVNVFVALCVCLGLYVLTYAIIGIIGGLHKSRPWLRVSMAMGLVALFFVAGVGVWLFMNAKQVGEIVDALSDAQVATFADHLGVSGMSKEGLKNVLANNIRSMAIASICWFATVFLMVLSNLYILRKLAQESQVQPISIVDKGMKVTPAAAPVAKVRPVKKPTH